MQYPILRICRICCPNIQELEQSIAYLKKDAAAAKIILSRTQQENVELHDAIAALQVFYSIL